MAKPIKCIIYDLDDLMVNSEPLHTESLETVLNKLGYSYNNLPKKLLSKFVGMRIIDILREIIKYLKLNENAEDLQKKKNEIFFKLVKEKLELMPGVQESIILFRNSNLRLALASSGIKEYINLVLFKFGLVNIFNVIVSGDDVKIGKPDPETYLVTCSKLNLEPEECIVLEDATSGIEAAKRAGCKCIAVKNPNTPSQNLSKADYILNNLGEISLEIIKSLVN